MYTVISLSGDGEYDKSGFASKQEAFDYIFEYLCDICQQDVKDGGYWAGPRDDPNEWWPVDNPLETNCGAEWAMMTDEEYEDITSTAEYYAIEWLCDFLERLNDNPAVMHCVCDKEIFTYPVRRTAF